MVSSAPVSPGATVAAIRHASGVLGMWNDVWPGHSGQMSRQGTSILSRSSISSSFLAHPLSGCRFRAVCGMEWHIRNWLRVRTLQTSEPRVRTDQFVQPLARPFSGGREVTVDGRCWHGECFLSSRQAARPRCATGRAPVERETLGRLLGRSRTDLRLCCLCSPRQQEAFIGRCMVERGDLGSVNGTLSF